MPAQITPDPIHRKKIRCSLQATLMRAGTSKGLFIHRHNLPADESQWAGPLLAAMGSQNCDARQIDGVGGATSTTSKVAVISPSTRPGIDVDYTFVQVAVGSAAVDFSGNCGNMCSGVGLFAAQEGLAHAKEGESSVDVRIFNTNTSRVIVDTVALSADGIPLEDGSYSIPGVKGTGSEIRVAFVDPAGSMTNKLFPTDRRAESLTVQERNGNCFTVKATLIDAANPFVLVDAATLPSYLITAKKDSAGYLEHMESIRRAGAVLMGLAKSTEEAAKVRGTPKLALLSPAPADQTPSDDDTLAVQVLAFSMGKPHPSLQLTGAACLASAVCVDGTIAHRIATAASSGPALRDSALADALARSTARDTTSPSQLPTDTDISSSPADSASPSESSTSTPPSETASPASKEVRIFHSSGAIDVGVVASCGEGWANVESCSVSRTARRIFDGTVYYYQ